MTLRLEATKQAVLLTLHMGKLAMQDRKQPLPKGEPRHWDMHQLEDFGRIRLSRHFFMRDMLYSEVASVHGMRNVPDDPKLAVKVGKQLCSKLLEPLHATFCHVSVRSAFRSVAVNDCGERYSNVAGTNRNHARHVWDRLDEKEKMGATVSIVIPWFVDYLKSRPATSWKAMAWWIHDHLPYSEVVFYRHRRSEFDYAAFNIRWHEKEVRCRIMSMFGPSPRSIPLDGQKHSPGDHAAEYPGFPKLERPNEFYPDHFG